MKCFYCNSHALQDIRDCYDAFDWLHCLDCHSWQANSLYLKYKYRRINNELYILREELKDSIHYVTVYKSLIEYVDEDSQPDMLITIPHLLKLKNMTIKECIENFNKYLNFL